MGIVCNRGVDILCGAEIFGAVVMKRADEREIERIEGWTHVYVTFGDEYVHVHGDFTVEELRLIARMQAKRERDKDSMR